MSDTQGAARYTRSALGYVPLAPSGRALSIADHIIILRVVRDCPCDNIILRVIRGHP